MFQILETDFAKRLWLKDREDFSIDGYRKEWQKPLHFVYGQDDGKEQQVLDEKWITGFAEEICAKREQHIRWSCSMEKEEQGYLVYISRRMGRDEGSACNSYQSIGLSCSKTGKTKAAVSLFLRRSVQYISIFRLRHIWQSSFFLFLKFFRTDSFYGGIRYNISSSGAGNCRWKAYLRDTVFFCVETRSEPAGKKD